MRCPRFNWLPDARRVSNDIKIRTKSAMTPKAPCSARSLVNSVWPILTHLPEISAPYPGLLQELGARTKCEYRPPLIPRDLLFGLVQTDR